MAFIASAITASSPTGNALPASRRAARCWPTGRRKPRSAPDLRRRRHPPRDHAPVAVDRWSGSPSGITARLRPDGHSGTTAHDRPRQTKAIPPAARLHADRPDGLRARAPVAPVLAVQRDHWPPNRTGSAVSHGQPRPHQPAVRRHLSARSPSRFSRRANTRATIPIAQNRPAGSFNPASMRSA